MNGTLEIVTTRHNPLIDPLMGGTGMNVNFVRVERWQP